jgi:hypothetical protein
MQYDAKQQAVDRMMRQGDPAYNGDVSGCAAQLCGAASAPGAVSSCSRLSGRCSVLRAGCWVSGVVQAETARGELLRSTRDRHQGAKATDIGFGLPGEQAWSAKLAAHLPLLTGPGAGSLASARGWQIDCCGATLSRQSVLPARQKGSPSRLAKLRLRVIVVRLPLSQQIRTGWR